VERAEDAGAVAAERARSNRRAIEHENGVLEGES